MQFTFQFFSDFLIFFYCYVFSKFFKLSLAQGLPLKSDLGCFWTSTLGSDGLEWYGSVETPRGWHRSKSGLKFAQIWYLIENYSISFSDFLAKNWSVHNINYCHIVKFFCRPNFGPNRVQFGLNEIDYLVLVMFFYFFFFSFYFYFLGSFCLCFF